MSTTAQFPRVLLSEKLGAAEMLRTLLTERGYQLAADIAEADVVVGAHDGLTQAALESGLGLVTFSDDALAAGAGIGFTASEHAEAAPLVAAGEETEAVTNRDLLARVGVPTLPVTGELSVSGPAAALLRRRGTRQAPGAIVAAVAQVQSGRVAVVAADLLDADAENSAAAMELAFNVITWASRRAVEAPIDVVRPAAWVDSENPEWLALKATVSALRELQITDGSVPNEQVAAGALVQTLCSEIADIAPSFPPDADYLQALIKDFQRWSDGGFAAPDFLDSLMAFHPESNRIDGLQHLVVFPMYTQNGSTDRLVEAVLLEVVWPEFVADLEAGDYSNKLFVPIRFVDFTAGYDTNSAVLFPETVAMREVPKFTWGGIFADRESARFRTVISAAAETTRLPLPPDAARMLDDQQLAMETFVMWDLIHDRTHMHGDLPFDPFMIKQRMPYFLYSLEELRCDLTAFRESVRLEGTGIAHARLVQYAIIFDRIFRFAITGSRVRNYDGLGGQLLFAWMHQHRVLHWTDNRLTIDWEDATEVVLELGRRIEDLYWRSIDRPKTSHWLAAYDLVSTVLTPNPASVWARGAAALPLDGPPKGLTDAVMKDEFPLSMFYEALSRKLSDVVSSTAGITG